MEIRNCPECADEVISSGLALWSDVAHAELDEPVLVAECQSPDCGWVGIESEYWSAAPTPMAAAAA